MKTRCKFYVTSVTETESIRPDEAGVHRPASLLKVTFNAAYSSDKTSENYAFWTSSPSGKMEIGGWKEDMEQFVPGSYWYIDEDLILPDTEPIEPAPDIWRLSLMEKPYDGRFRVQLRPTKGDGLFEVSIDNKSAWDNYTRLDDLYRMEILPAPK